MSEPLASEPLPEPLTAYRLPDGRLVTVRATAPSITFEVTPGFTVVAIRVDLREPW